MRCAEMRFRARICKEVSLRDYCEADEASSAKTGSGSQAHQKEYFKAKDEVLKCENKFDWEDYLLKPIQIGDLVIIKTGRYTGEVGEVLSRTKKFRYKIKLITMEHEIIHHKAKNLEKTDDV